MTKQSLTINLLSGRSDNKQRQQHQAWIMLIISGIFSVCLIIMMHYLLLKQLISDQQLIIDLKSQLTEQTDRASNSKQLQLQKEHLISQLNTLNILLTDREQTKQLLIELSNIIPAGVYLTSLTRENQNLTLTGKTVTPAQLTSLINNINQSNNMVHPTVD